VPCALSSQPAASAFHRALKIQRRAYGVMAQVDGKNCARPELPDGFLASGFNPDSQRQIDKSNRNDWRYLSAA